MIILNHSKKNIDLIENNSEDIKDAVRDMLELMDNNYELDDKKKFLHAQYWTYLKNIDNIIVLIYMQVFKSHIVLFMINIKTFFNN